jgi:hypothetical protein
MAENTVPHKTEDAYVCKMCGAVFNGPYLWRPAGAMTFKSWTEMHNQPHCSHFNEHGAIDPECGDCQVAYVMET